jgi:hypothetical protein
MLKELIGPKSYKKAFECKRCPQRNDEEGCPVWLEVRRINNISKEEITLAGCGHQLVPYMLNEILVQIPRSSAEISGMREDISNKVATAAALFYKHTSNDKYLEGEELERLSGPN